MKTAVHPHEGGEESLIGPDQEEGKSFHDGVRFFLIDSRA
jgi:hypothetical protein